MNCLSQGSIVVHLGPEVTYDHSEISSYITSVLEQLKLDNAYGVLIGIKDNEGPAVPTIVFGIPPPNPLSVVLPTAPFGIPVLVKADLMMSINGFQAAWSTNPVQAEEKITLAALSLGVEGCLDTGGSFGGFLKRSTALDEYFGITAAHCLPQTQSNTPVCTPSSVEITGRLNRLLRYTSFCPTSNRLHLNPTKEREAKLLLDKFHFLECQSGTLFLDPAAEFVPKQGVLTGKNVGHIVTSQFGNYPNLFHNYDKLLAKSGYPIFTAEESWETRMDWSIFSCEPERYGGNVYEGETIRETGLLYPGAKVEKIGRTTGTRYGFVNGYELQTWHSSVATYEIAITGDLGIPFAEVGDSGGCVFITTNQGNRAAGILIGINGLNTFAIVTPMNYILDALPGYEWA